MTSLLTKRPRQQRFSGLQRLRSGSVRPERGRGMGGIMRFTRWNRPRAVLAVAGLTLATIAVTGLPTASAARVPGPVLKLEAAQRSITLPGFRGRVFLDPGIWLAALGSPLQFDVQRVTYTRPITITQVIHPPFGGTIRRSLPASTLDGFNGLRDFVVLTVRNSAGKVVLTKPVSFCPNGETAQVSPGSPPTSPYPTSCAFDPFPKGMVWGIQKDWAVDPTGGFFGFFPGPGSFGSVKLPLGKFRVTESISPADQRLFAVSARDATATVNVKVVKQSCCPVPGCCGAGGARRTGGSRTLPTPAARTLANPPRSALPDLVPLPAWSITVSH